MTWADVAQGKADSRIDAEAAYLKSNFNYPFFLSIWHEPENDVIQTDGSGMTASDYSAMFRHVVLRLRADGATKPVIVMNYMGFDNYTQDSWFNQLWPGSDVVDWIGLDPYASGAATGYHSGDFSRLVNRPLAGTSFPGYYSWITKTYPGMPIMLAEFGIYESDSNPGGKATYLDSIEKLMPDFPAIKGLVYFDYNDPTIADGGNTSPDSSPSALAAFKALANWSVQEGPQIQYADGSVQAVG